MKKFWKDFKAFISKGNIIDLAVAVVIGGAFGKIVTSLVNDIIMPLITWALGAASLADLSIVLKYVEKDGVLVPSLTWNYGNFLQTIIDFLLIAFCIFVVLKLLMASQQKFKTLENNMLKGKLTKEQKEILKEKCIDLKDKKAVQACLAEEQKRLDDEKAQEEANKPKVETTDEILKDIRNLLKETKIEDEKEITSKE